MLGLQHAAGNNLDLVCAANRDSLRPFADGLLGNPECLGSFDRIAEMLDNVSFFHNPNIRRLTDNRNN